MQLFWHGYSSIRIEGKMGETEVTLLTDPFESESSVRFPRTVEPDLLVLSHQDTSRFNLEGALGKPFTVADPGEYEVKNAFVMGIQDPAVDPEAKERPIIYRFVVENMSIGFLGQLKRKLTDKEIEALENIDILILPVGGSVVMDAKTAGEVIAEIEPRIVVPIFYDIPGLKTKLDSVDAFVKTLGATKRQDMNKFKVAKKDLPTDDMQVIVLERA
jgi:L-ascorbate metabolism protein UlaG (beta-lactamase superfamily)